MEDAREQLAALARSESGCMRCRETAGRRLRAVPGGGHPHAAVMVVSPAPSESDEAGVRAPTAEELDACFDYLSRELSITTPHAILAVGDETARFVLRKLFRDLPYAQGDALELRVFDNPAFKVVRVATPAELRERDAREQRAYVDRLRQLAQLMGL